LIQERGSKKKTPEIRRITIAVGIAPKLVGFAIATETSIEEEEIQITVVIERLDRIT